MTGPGRETRAEGREDARLDPPGQPIGARRLARGAVAHVDVVAADRHVGNEVVVVQRGTDHRLPGFEDPVGDVAEPVRIGERHALRARPGRDAAAVGFGLVVDVVP